jgi:hypothetical protein
MPIPLTRALNPIGHHTASQMVFTSVAEPHHFDATPALGKTFDTAPPPTLLYNKPTFVKQAKFNIRVRASFSSDFL